MCQDGARWVREHVLDAYPESNLRVQVVWTPVLRGDDRAAAIANAAILDGPRTQHFFDPDNAVGRWCFEHIVSERPELASKQIFAISGGVTWDAFFLYAGAARSLDDLDQLLACGATVIDDRLALSRGIEGLILA